MKARVVIYSKPGCHLCDEAKEVIVRAASDAGYEVGVDYSLEVINVESEGWMFEKYGNDIPVILINGVEVARHWVDREKFLESLKRAEPEPGA